MSILAKQFIAIHLKEIRVVSTQLAGRFMLSFHIFERPKTQNAQAQFAVPINIVEGEKSPQNQSSETIDNTYQTRSFPLKPGNHALQLNEICVFKHDFDMFSQGKDHHLQLMCELIFIEHNGRKVVSTFEGKFYTTSGSQFLCIDFYAPYACQLTGSVHSCLYNYQFMSDPTVSSLQSYCSKMQAQQVERILRYMLTESRENQNRLKELINEDVSYDLEKTQVNKLKRLVSQIERTQLKTEYNQEIDVPTTVQKIKSGIVEGEKEQYSFSRRNRKKIFSKRNSDFSPVEIIIRQKEQSPAQIKFKQPQTPKKESSQEREVSVREFQTVIHTNALKVYESWNKLIKILLNQKDKDCLLMGRLRQKFKEKTRKKIDQGISKFKGSFDIDLYAHEQELRSKMAYQVRNQSVIHFQELNQFHFCSNQLFSPTRPMFFEEQTDSHPTLVKDTPQKLLIFLVHGLGACRLDMEKLKNEIRRYYGERVTIVVSSSNEGRTQGDIKEMSIRLTSEVEHYLARQGQNKPMISFIGHSMGGVIIRGALPNLAKYKHLFYSLVTLSSPHIGYSYSNSKLVDAGLWVLNNWKKCQSLIQLTMQDSQDPTKTFIYNLSKQSGLEWFSKVTFVSSRQDLYVPYYSARVQKSQDSMVDAKKGLKKGQIHLQTIDNILNSIKGKLTRIDVNFYIKQQNMDNLIGRAAHISFINNVEVLRTFLNCADRIIF